MSLNEFNFTLFQNVVKFLPREAKYNLKLVNKKFNNRIDMSQDYEQWKLEKAEDAFGADGCPNVHIVVKGDDLFYRKISFVENLLGYDTSVLSDTTRITNINWKNLEYLCFNDLDNEDYWKLYDSLIFERQMYLTREDEVYFNKTIIKIVNGTKEDNTEAEILFPQQ